MSGFFEITSSVLFSVLFIQSKKNENSLINERVFRNYSVVLPVLFFLNSRNKYVYAPARELEIHLRIRSICIEYIYAHTYTRK